MSLPPPPTPPWASRQRLFDLGAGRSPDGTRLILSKSGFAFHPPLGHTAYNPEVPGDQGRACPSGQVTAWVSCIQSPLT